MSANGNPYTCVKCGGSAAETGQIRTSGGALSAMFDVSSERFTYVSCARCGYTEFWRGELGVDDTAAEPVPG
jgi:predicted nucleic-acid-binding Zn-ribbon protein